MCFIAARTSVILNFLAGVSRRLGASWGEGFLVLLRQISRSHAVERRVQSGLPRRVFFVYHSSPSLSLQCIVGGYVFAAD